MAKPTKEQIAWFQELHQEFGETARSAQHAAGNLDNRHVEILRAALARVNVSVLYQFVDTANRPWPTWRHSAAGLFRSGSAWPGRSQKDGLPTCRGGTVR